MSLSWKCGMVLTLSVVLVVGIVIGMSLNGTAGAADKVAAEKDKKAAVEKEKVTAVADKDSKATAAAADKAPASGCAHYTVVETEGTHLIVTDNQTNILYFYTIDEGEKPGADLHLRGTADLNQVGKATMKPTLINPRKKKQ